jgi:hypothetical protein
LNPAGLRTARALLQALGAPEPAMPSFDPAKFEPTEEILIEPEQDTSSG